VWRAWKIANLFLMKETENEMETLETGYFCDVADFDAVCGGVRQEDQSKRRN
jgi:hypothetical protein